MESIKFVFHIGKDRLGPDDANENHSSKIRYRVNIQVTGVFLQLFYNV